MLRYVAFFLFVALLITPISTQYAHASLWYPGQGLKQGDYYRYDVCWTDWHNCSPLEIDFWVKGAASNGGDGWDLEFLAIDGSIVQKGKVTIGSITPDPLYADKNVADYANVYRNTIAWLDAFSTKHLTQDLTSPSWGRTGSVGGQTVASMGQDTITVQAGTFKSWIIGWHKGVDNMIWVSPELAFPVKGQVYVDITSGAVPPPDYTLELLETGNSQTEPKFLQVNSIGILETHSDCPQPDMVQNSESGVLTTDAGSMIVEYRYSPKNPPSGCPVEWRIWFEKAFDQTQRYNNLHYDFFIVNDQGQKLSSVAADLGRSDLFAPVGEDVRTIIMQGTPPLTHVVIAVFGTGPEGTTPDITLAGLVKIDVKTAPPLDTSITGTGGNQTIVIPSWIKNNAKWWSDGSIGDGEFVKGIQYLIQNGIMQIPHGLSGSGTAQPMPSWIKNNAKWWSEGSITNDEFVKAIQYLITTGVIVITS